MTIGVYGYHKYGADWLGLLQVIKTRPGIYVCRRLQNGDVLDIYTRDFISKGLYERLLNREQRNEN